LRSAKALLCFKNQVNWKNNRIDNIGVIIEAYLDRQGPDFLTNKLTNGMAQDFIRELVIIAVTMEGFDENKRGLKNLFVNLLWNSKDASFLFAKDKNGESLLDVAYQTTNKNKIWNQFYSVMDTYADADVKKRLYEWRVKTADQHFADKTGKKLATKTITKRWSFLANMTGSQFVAAESKVIENQSETSKRALR
jgi:hypothetical protein